MQRIRAGQAGFTKPICSVSALNILFLALFPIVLWLFRGSAAVVATAVMVMVLLGVALRLIAVGQAVALEHAAAKSARRPRFPRKLAGSALIGFVVLILAGHHFATLSMPLLLGLAAAGLSVVAFGIDPMRDKGLDDPEEIARHQTDAVVAEIEQALAMATHRVAGLGDADLTRRTQRAQDIVRNLMRRSGCEPAEMSRLRKPAAKFVQILQAEVERLEESWEGEEYLFARRRFVAKLEVLTESFEGRLRKGATSDRDAYDVEADLLLDRMRHDSAA